MTPAAITAVAAGGALGSLSRWMIGATVPSYGAIPFATLAVNVIGALGIGVVVKLFAGAVEPSLWRLALATGFFGGFTTFSALSIETLLLVQQGRPLRAALYVVITLLLGLTATWIGYVMAPTPNA